MPSTTVRPLRASTATRAFATCALTFVAAAAVIAVVDAAAPVTRGWWLVAYLTLVGGASQLLLGGGLIALATRAGARAPGPGARGGQLVLWNAGSLIVAVADRAQAPAGVLTGSVALLGALALFAAGLRQLDATARRPTPRWTSAYVVLLIFLAVSVAIGAALAGALPGR